MKTAKLHVADDVIGYEEGLRGFLSKSFTYMALALLLTVAASAVSLHFMPLVDGKPTLGVSHFIAIGMSFVMLMFTGISAQFSRTPTLAAVGLAGYAAVTGYMLAPLALQYTSVSLVNTFLAASCVFGSAAIYGSVTKHKLTRWGGFFLSALFGLLAAMVINVFMQSAMMDYVLSALGVLLFAGLTAYDIQKLEQFYYERVAKNSEGLAIYGALTLYLDFVNLFLFLLRFFGVRTGN